MNVNVMHRADSRGVSGRRRAGGPRVRRRTSAKAMWAPVALQVGAMVGIGALLYPTAADWFATLAHNAEVSGYVRAIEALPEAERLEHLQTAQRYNSFMPPGLLRDPYSPGEDDPGLYADTAYRAYEQVLRVSANGVIGEMSYPRLGIGLPVYHGTSDDILSRGVGHLYGSSLPVGGSSTHSVLTSHSGLVHAELFTPLTGAQIGDTFTVMVLGETHTYRVDQIETVLPDQTSSLEVVDGRDYVTLITCTPIGVNSHRILVRGVRLADDAFSADAREVAGDGKAAGFPWWSVIFVGASGAFALVLLVKPRSRVAISTAAHAAGAPREGEAG
ncbi:class C sortase [Salinibacterium sp. ZJ70]|uniref:class C sortase n=1 Tax=Salinibacterium sp. ZJ70 TaxID=2708084 RepID=UPI001CD80E6E|nr:class C sortase [Salinibacterium sp. ZJ70]